MVETDTIAPFGTAVLIEGLSALDWVLIWCPREL